MRHQHRRGCEGSRAGYTTPTFASKPGGARTDSTMDATVTTTWAIASGSMMRRRLDGSVERGSRTQLSVSQICYLGGCHARWGNQAQAGEARGRENKTQLRRSALLRKRNGLSLSGRLCQAVFIPQPRPGPDATTWS
jgi:hypothetical protein